MIILEQLILRSVIYAMHVTLFISKADHKSTLCTEKYMYCNYQVRAALQQSATHDNASREKSKFENLHQTMTCPHDDYNQNNICR